MNTSQKHFFVVADVVYNLQVHLANHGDVVGVHKDNVVHRDGKTFRSLVACRLLVSFAFTVGNVWKILKNEFEVAVLVIFLLGQGVLSKEKLRVVAPAKTSH